MSSGGSSLPGPEAADPFKALQKARVDISEGKHKETMELVRELVKACGQEADLNVQKLVQQLDLMVAFANAPLWVHARLHELVRSGSPPNWTALVKLADQVSRNVGSARQGLRLLVLLAGMLVFAAYDSRQELADGGAELVSETASLLQAHRCAVAELHCFYPHEVAEALKLAAAGGKEYEGYKETTKVKELRGMLKFGMTVDLTGFFTSLDERDIIMLLLALGPYTQRHLRELLRYDYLAAAADTPVFGFLMEDVEQQASLVLRAMQGVVEFAGDNAACCRRALTHFCNLLAHMNPTRFVELHWQTAGAEGLAAWAVAEDACKAQREQAAVLAEVAAQLSSRPAVVEMAKPGAEQQLQELRLKVWELEEQFEALKARQDKELAFMERQVAQSNFGLQEIRSMVTALCKAVGAFLPATGSMDALQEQVGGLCITEATTPIGKTVPALAASDTPGPSTSRRVAIMQSPTLKRAQEGELPRIHSVQERIRALQALVEAKISKK